MDSIIHQIDYKLLDYGIINNWLPYLDESMDIVVSVGRCVHESIVRELLTHEIIVRELLDNNSIDEINNIMTTKMLSIGIHLAEKTETEANSDSVINDISIKGDTHVVTEKCYSNKFVTVSIYVDNNSICDIRIVSSGICVYLLTVGV